MRKSFGPRNYLAAVAAFVLSTGACGSGDADVVTTTAPTVTTVATTVATSIMPPPEAQLTVEESVVTVNGTEIPRADPTAIEVDDQVALGEGALAFLRLGDSFVFELIKRTKLRLESVEALSVDAFLESGHLRFTVKEGTDAQLTLTTPNTVLKTLRSGTQFTFCQAQTGGVCVSVNEGEVEVTKAGKTETFVGGESSFAGPDDPLGPPICVPAEAFDEWFAASRRNEDPSPLSELVGSFPPCSEASADSTMITVIVPGAVQWTDTGLDVRQDDIVAIEAGGAVALAVGRAVADPDGDLDVEVRGSNLPGLEEVNHGLLVGRIGETGVPFVVGRSALFRAETGGRLFLGINDVGLENNSGEFVANITVIVP